MSFGLQIFNASGTLTFESPTAAGGVCLGIFTVDPAGSTFTFPSMSGSAGRLLSLAGGGVFSYTTDNTLGYLRFVIPPTFLSGSASVMLFAL